MFTQKLKGVFARKTKGKPVEQHTSIQEKLQRHKRLTEEEFWSYYAELNKKGPEVRYPRPENWSNYEFSSAS